MFARDLVDCEEIITFDNSVLRELFNPLKDDLNLRYSLAHAVIKPGEKTSDHKLKTSEVYFIIQGRGIIYIDNKSKEVKEGLTIYIPLYST